MKTLKVQDWWGVKYMSRADLFEAGQSNLLEMKKEINEFGSYYFFFNDGKLVAKFYQDHTFGFCTQPYGVIVQNI